MKKYNCEIDNEDFMTVGVEDGYACFEMFNYSSDGEENCAVLLSEEQAIDVINMLQSKLALDKHMK